MTQFENVSLVFGAGTPDENRALNSVNLNIRQGDFITLIGSNGAGKSSLFNALAGLYPPDSGRIEIAGQDMAELKGHERMALIETLGMLFQQGGLFDSLPVWENIAFKLINRRRLDRKKAKEVALHAEVYSAPPPKGKQSGGHGKFCRNKGGFVGNVGEDDKKEKKNKKGRP